jgi:hypothetical protein
LRLGLGIAGGMLQEQRGDCSGREAEQRCQNRDGDSRSSSGESFSFCAGEG